MLKSFVKRASVALAIVALLMLPAGKASAQSNSGAKPAFVVSIASIDEQLADIGYLATAAGQPQVGAMLTLGAGEFVQHFDTTKPAGAFVSLDQGAPQVVAFLGVNDLDEVLAQFSGQLGGVEEDGDLRIISAPDGTEIYMKESGGWAFMSNDASSLDSLPGDPTGMLDGMDSAYNIGVQINLSSVPAPMKEMAIAQLEEGFQQAMDALEDADPDAAELQRKVNEMSMQSLIRSIEEMDQLTIGWSIDAEAKSTYFDFSMTALPNTKLARQIDLMKESKSSFSGFLLKNSAANFHFVSTLLEDDIKLASGMLSQLKEQAIAELENDDSLGDDEMELAASIVERLMDTVQKTIESGKLDGGAAVVLDDESVALVAGGYVADGRSLESLVRKLVEVAEQEAPPEVEFNLDSDTYKGVTFHQVRIEIPDHEDQARAIFGDSLVATVGVADKAAYFAIGKNAEAVLKQVIDQSEADASKSLPSSQFNLALTPILEFASSVEGDAITTEIAEKLKESGKDRIQAVSTVSGNRATTRIEIQEGVIVAVGHLVQQFMSAFGGGF